MVWVQTVKRSLRVILSFLSGNGSSTEAVCRPPRTQILRQYLPGVYVTRTLGWHLWDKAQRGETRHSSRWHYLPNFQQPQLSESKRQTQGHHCASLQRPWVQVWVTRGWLCSFSIILMASPHFPKDGWDTQYFSTILGSNPERNCIKSFFFRNDK